MSQPELTAEQQQALDQNHGFVRGPSYVLMSTDIYREMMGVGTDEQLRASLEAIEQGLQDVESGRTHAMDDVFRQLDEKYGVHH